MTKKALYLAVLAILVTMVLVADPRPVTLAADEAADEAAAETTTSATRSRHGLQVLYDFRSTEGATVKDISGVGRPLHLKIDDLNSVRRAAGSLEILDNTLIRSDGPATKLAESVRRSGEFTIEAWIRPANVRQAGPARIVTMSPKSTQRNFTLGQDGDRFDIRLRTTKTGTNGLPSTSSKSQSVEPRLTHVVYTRDRNGRTRIYLDGEMHLEKKVAGSTSGWERFPLALANELTGDRSWLGTYYLVAAYSRDLLPLEVKQHYKAGIQLQPLELASEDSREKQHFFETRVATLISQKCLECHDSASREGGFDLSRRESALEGGDSGPAIVAGKPDESLLWESVESDAMPAERNPLSDTEKELLRRWIKDGAVFSLDFIDPAVYVHEGRSGVNPIQRLTVSEYIESVRSAVGVDITEEARRILPPDLRADGFSNTSYNLNVDLGHVDAYAQLAEIIVQQMDVVAFASRFSRRQRFTDDDMGELISKMGKWILRGPLEEHEIIAYRGISTTVASGGGDFETAVRYMLQAMLQSPRFIYRVENQRGDGSSWPVGEYELASRLSFILWGGPPDEELMRAADQGQLLDHAQVEAQVARMLKDPRTVQRSMRFAYEWLNLARLDNLRPNHEHFPNWNPVLAADMREETLAYFKEVVWQQNRPLADLLNAQFTFATPRLARHYGIPAATSEGPDDVPMRYDLADVPSRGGLLTQGSLLTAGGDEASMVTRGLLVMHELLRGVVQDPPPCVDTTPVATKAGLTQRGIAEERIANHACGGCHSKFEPLAFGLEKFDGLGTFHELDRHGNVLRDDGEILIPGAAESVNYESSGALMDLLADSERVRESITWKVTQFALGRPLGAADARIVNQIHRAAQKDGGTYESLLKAIVLSDLVQKTRTEASASLDDP